MLKAIFLLSLCLFCGVINGFAQKKGDPCAFTKYEDKNQITPDPLILKRAIGNVFDSSQNSESQSLSSVCIALFEETTKKLVATVSPGAKGGFKFGKVAGGRYRLVVKHTYNAFCVANIPLEINRGATENKKIAVHMRPSAIDQCSYGDLL